MRSPFSLAGPAPFLALLLFTPPPTAAAPIAVPLSPDDWQIRAEEWRIEPYLGRDSLLLFNGVATPKDVELLNGVIEFDVAFASLRRGFSGLRFRALEGGSHEHLYLRPHQSGMPDANQYTPVFYGVSAWQLYHGTGYGEPIEYPVGEWIPVRVVVAGERADVYVGSLDKPLFAVRHLWREPAPGGLALDSFLADARFSNFRYDPAEPPGLAGEPPAAPEDPAGVVRSWSVSEALAESAVADAHALPEELLAALEWRTLAADPGGITNLARLPGASREDNTVIARLRLTADTPTTARVRFGYSDRVRVFTNGSRVYAGTNDYRSRDYRYLGTIGLFDEIAVAVGPGETEVLFAVSESFGGWGILATVAGEGVRVVEP